MQNKKGFTLIELMIVVAIIAILAMIAVPMYQRYIERARNSAAQATLEQIATANVAYASESSVFLPSAAANTTNAVFTLLMPYGFRPDPNVGVEFVAPAGGQPGFIVYAAHKAQGSRLFVYDNIAGSGVQPMFDLANVLDATTGLAGAATNAPCTNALTVWEVNPANPTTAVQAGTPATLTITADGRVQ